MFTTFKKHCTLVLKICEKTFKSQSSVKGFHKNKNSRDLIQPCRNYVLQTYGGVFDWDFNALFLVYGF